MFDQVVALQSKNLSISNRFYPRPFYSYLFPHLTWLPAFPEVPGLDFVPFSPLSRPPLMSGCPAFAFVISFLLLVTSGLHVDSSLSTRILGLCGSLSRAATMCQLSSPSLSSTAAFFLRLFSAPGHKCRCDVYHFLSLSSSLST